MAWMAVLKTASMRGRDGVDANVTWCREMRHVPAMGSVYRGGGTAAGFKHLRKLQVLEWKRIG